MSWLGETYERRVAGSGEEGFALVGAIAILFVMVALGAAITVATTSGLQQSVRGTADTQAQEAADAAASLAWNRINETQSSITLSASTPCPYWSSSGTVTAAAGTTYSGESGYVWCPATSVPLPNVSSASYQVEELASSYAPQAVVGTAKVGGVTRRAKMALASSGTALFGIYAVESKTSLDFQNGSEITGGSVRSDMSIKLEDTQVPCHIPNGSVTPGPGYTVTQTNGAGLCGQSNAPATGAISWQNVTAPSTDNDSDITNGGNIIWSAANKTLTIQNNATLTLTNNVYTFCSLNIPGGTLQLNPSNGQAVKIYMLPPSSCSGTGQYSGANVTTGAESLDLQNNNSWIENSTNVGGNGPSAQGVQVYLTGATWAYLNNSSSYQFNGVIYAPNNPSPATYAVEVINQAAMKGAIAAYSSEWTANAVLAYDSTAANVTYGSGGTYTQSGYSECTPSAGSGNAPDTSC